MPKLELAQYLKSDFPKQKNKLSINWLTCHHRILTLFYSDFKAIIFVPILSYTPKGNLFLPFLLMKKVAAFDFFAPDFVNMHNVLKYPPSLILEGVIELINELSAHL